jgi:exosortase A
VPLFIYLIFLRRKRISGISPGVSFWGLAILAFLAAVWLLADLGEIRVVKEFAMIGILGAVVWTVLGSAVLRVLSFPLAFLLFAVPCGVTLVGPLQNFTAWFAVHSLTLSNVPAVLENHTIFLPTSTWTVGETCSGIRYLFASTVFGVFYSSLVYRSQKRRCIFVLVSMVLPIIANGVRAYGIVLLSYATNYRLAAGVDHIIYGGVFFVGLQIALMTIGLHWREKPEDYAPVALGEPANKSRGLQPKQGIVAVAAIVVIVTAPLLAKHFWESSSAKATPQELSVTLGPSWQQVETLQESWNPDFRSPENQFRRQYEFGEHRVDLCWAYYSGRNPAQLDDAAKGYGDPQLWSRASEKIEHGMLNGHEVTIEKDLLQSGTNSRPLWRVFWVAGEYTASATRVKLLQARARLLGKSAATGVIVLGTEDPLDGVNAAQKTLQNFLAHTLFSISQDAGQPSGRGDSPPIFKEH